MCPPEGLTVSKLREEVCSAVETEIHNQVTEFEITDQEHIEISHAAWARSDFTHLNRDKIESNLSVPGIQGH